MLTDTEGIVLRQVKTSYDRKILHLFTKKFGKISAGTNMGQRGRNKSSLVLRPFTHGRYELYKGRYSYNINSAEVIKSYYRIGENVDKYMNGAYVLEFTEKAIAEDAPAPDIFNLLIDFLNMLEERDKGIGTLVLAYQVKLFKCIGIMPELKKCTVCGKVPEGKYFSIEHGGVVCSSCAHKIAESSGRLSGNVRGDTGEAANAGVNGNAADTGLSDSKYKKNTAAGTENSNSASLINCDEFDIINILEYFISNPLEKLKNTALNQSAGRIIQQIVREYAEYYLDIADIKSQGLI